jgi:hypothetical protein
MIAWTLGVSAAQQRQASSQKAAGPAAREAPDGRGASPADQIDSDRRAEIPKFLANSYFSIRFGSINYPFSALQLEPGFQSETVKVAHTAVQVVMLGHRFHKYLSGQFSYMRPVQYVIYTNVNGTRRDHAVSVAMGEITIKSQVPLTPRLSVYGEIGAAARTRRGFEIEKQTVVADTHVASRVFGTGLEYQLNDRWDALAGVSYSGAHPQHREPETVFTSLGFRYNLRPRAAETPRAGQPRFLFRQRVAQLGYTAGGLGYGVNNFVSSTVPVFWGGDIRVGNGMSARYQQNVFHTRSLFSLDLGASIGYWSTYNRGDRFVTLSAYPLLRFTLLRRPSADYYVSYSFAGPTLISQSVIEGEETGTHFTFQDMFGAGAFIGKSRSVVIEVNLGHYSNGNLFASNPGLKIPLTMSVGYAF